MCATLRVHSLGGWTCRICPATIDHMVGPCGAGHPAAMERLVHEAQLLHDRLHRITVALALTEEMAAEILDLAAQADVGRTPDYLTQAERARATAAECRAFAARLETLRPF